MVARAKAESAFTTLGRPVLVDDSGLEILAWGGFPGALVKWLVKSADVGTISRMLDPFPDRRARAVCVLAGYDGERRIEAVGVAEGSIAAAPRGRGGFGWDPIFVPDGSPRTFAEMDADEKGRLSHRGHAWRALARVLAGAAH